MKSKRLIVLAAVVAAILAVPLLAMQFTDEVNWTTSDFAIMGVLLFTTGLLLDIAWRNIGRYRGVAAVAIVLAFLAIWVHLAVGIVNSWPFAGN